MAQSERAKRMLETAAEPMLTFADGYRIPNTLLVGSNCSASVRAILQALGSATCSNGGQLQGRHLMQKTTQHC